MSKPRLAFTSIDATSLPAEDPGMAKFAHAAGRSVGIEEDDDGGMRVVSLEPSGETRALESLPPGNYARPDISADGTRAIVVRGDAVEEIEIASDVARTIYKAPKLRRAIYVTGDQILLIAAGKQTLCKRANDTLEPVAVLDGLGNVLGATRLNNGRFVLVDHATQSFLVAVGRGVMTLIKKAPKAKSTWAVLQDRLFVGIENAWSEVSNLDVIYSSSSASEPPSSSSPDESP